MHGTVHASQHYVCTCSEGRVSFAQVEAMPPAVTAHARQCRDALLAITERVLTRKK